MKPIQCMEIRDFDGKRKIFNKYDDIDKILLHPSVKDRKIVIMSIVGDYRKGKSFYLDYCLRFMYANYASVSKPTKPSPTSNWMGDKNEALKGFSWKHGCVADTKGILFWPDVFLHDDESGDKVAIILMDTQGLFEIGSTTEENGRIFGLSTLISSIQIVNVKGVLKESEIEYLEMATSLTKTITQKKCLGNTLQKPFQKLLFLIRDWNDEDVGFGYESGDKYLESFLSIEENQNTKTQAVRKNIHESFDKIKCFLLNHPGTGVSKKNYQGEWAKLDDEFVDNLKVFIESILSPENLTKKSILGKEVTGLELKNFIHEYLNAFSDTKLPEIENILQTMIDNQMKGIVAEQLKVYQTEMNENLDFNRPDFPQWIEIKHKFTKYDAAQRFVNANEIGNDASIKKFSNILEIEIEESYKSWHETTMREYRRFQEFKKEMQRFNSKNEKYKIPIEELREESRRQAQEKAKAKQEYDEKMRIQEELIEKLNTQILNMNFTVKEREEEIKKVKENLNQKTKEYEQKFKEQEQIIENFYAVFDHHQKIIAELKKEVEVSKKEIIETLINFQKSNEN